LDLILKNIKENTKVLDAGCGEGSITIWLAEKFPHAQFVGIDISDIGIKYAKEEVQKKRLKEVGTFE